MQPSFTHLGISASPNMISLLHQNFMIRCICSLFYKQKPFLCISEELILAPTLTAGWVVSPQRYNKTSHAANSWQVFQPLLLWISTSRCLCLSCSCGMNIIRIKSAAISFSHIVTKPREEMSTKEKRRRRREMHRRCLTLRFFGRKIYKEKIAANHWSVNKRKHVSLYHSFFHLTLHLWLNLLCWATMYQDSRASKDCLMWLYRSYNSNCCFTMTILVSEKPKARTSSLCS